MKFETSKEVDQIVGEIFATFGIEDTPTNRTNFVAIAVNVGVSTILTAGSTMASIFDSFPQFDLRAFKDENERISAEPSATEQFAPDICPDCERRVLYQTQYGRWVCNCRSYEHGPKPAAICPHCNSDVVGEHYYWRCNCNRYDSRPDAVTPVSVPKTDPEGWSSSFPGT